MKCYKFVPENEEKLDLLYDLHCLAILAENSLEAIRNIKLSVEELLKSINSAEDAEETFRVEFIDIESGTKLSFKLYGSKRGLIGDSGIINVSVDTTFRNPEDLDFPQ